MNDIMVVDDEEITLSVMKSVLQNEGIECDVTSNPAEFIRSYQSNPYNIVITDVMMPVVSGIELIRQVKNINPLCNIIVMTAYSSMSRVVECVELGAFDYITKPITDIQLILSIIKTTIARVERWKSSFGITGSSEA